MAYNPINFNNGTAGGTPLSASNLRHVENGIVSAHNDIATLTANVNSLSERYGTPLVAHTASEMTDTAKIYVYVGSETGYTTGNWYYYDGDSWESGGAYNSTAVNTETTLTQENMAADAKKVGDEISDLLSQISSLSSIPIEVKRAMDTLFQNVAFKNADIYSDELTIFHAWATAINLLSISAVFDQGQNAIYDTDSLDSLKQYLTVTASFDDGTSSAVSNYALSGTLEVGTSTITVTYEDKIATFNVTVTSSVLYSLENREITADERITTGVDLIGEDKDYSYAMDISLTAKSGAFKLLWQYETADPWRGLTVGRQSTSSNNFNVKCCATYETISTSAPNLTRVRLVVTHEKASNQWNMYYILNDGTSVSTKTHSETFVPLSVDSNGVIIGLHNTNTWAGTINKFKILANVMTSAEADAFLTGN